MTDAPNYPPTILAPESRELRMPNGTPLGLGILGAARFAAIRRVLDQATRAAHAKANFHEAEGAVAHSLVNREIARERLRHIDEIREEAAAQIADGSRIASLQRRLRILELEDQVASAETVRANRQSQRTVPSPVSGGQKPDDAFEEFIAQMRRMPDIVREAAKAKAAIIAAAGGEDNLTETDRGVCEMFDTMTTSFMSKVAGEAAL